MINQKPRLPNSCLVKIIITLITFILIMPLVSGVQVNAKRHYSRRRIHRTVHQNYYRHEYLIGTARHPVYILNWRDISNFRRYRGTFRAKNDIYDLPVRVVSEARVGNNTFVKVKFNRYYRNLDGWTYSKLLSHNPRRGYYIDFQSLINDVTKAEIGYNASKYLSQMKMQTFRDLNKDRRSHHIPVLRFNPKLNALAKIRAQQIAVYFSHYDPNGIPYTTDDAPLAKLPANFQASENIASAGLGVSRLNNDTKRYYSRNGYDMANNDNNGMMYHDQAEHNGHRYNILSRENTLVGIGTAYNPNKRSFFVAEDFGNHDPLSSENVNRF